MVRPQPSTRWMQEFQRDKEHNELLYFTNKNEPKKKKKNNVNLKVHACSMVVFVRPHTEKKNKNEKYTHFVLMSNFTKYALAKGAHKDMQKA